MSDHPSFRHVASFVDATRGLSIHPSRVRGTLLGLAVGNALGIPFEGLSRTEVQKKPPDRLREIGASEKDRLWDDDTAQTVILAEAFLAKGHLDSQDMADRLLDWLHQNRRGIGLLTAEVLSNLTTGVEPREAARIAWDKSRREAAGNGAVMRCAPIAIACWTSGERLVDQAVESSTITHFDPRCVATVVALTAIIAVCLTGIEPNLELLAEALEKDDSPPEVSEATKHVPLSALDLDNPHEMGYTIKTHPSPPWSGKVIPHENPTDDLEYQSAYRPSQEPRDGGSRPRSMVNRSAALVTHEPHGSLQKLAGATVGRNLMNLTSSQ